MTSTSWPRPLLLGHRGARLRAPENTLAAFELALAHGCDGFEFDVRCTSDQRAIICHDAKLAGVDLATSTFQQVCAACSSDHPKTLLIQRGKPAEPVACLEDVLEQFGARAFLDIELKVPGLENLLISAIRTCPPQAGYVVSSFLPEIIKSLRSSDPRLPLGIIFDAGRMLRKWKELPVQYIIPHQKLAGRELIEEAHDMGRKVLVWTVNQQKDMLRLADLGVDGIISDDTELLRKSFACSRR